MKYVLAALLCFCFAFVGCRAPDPLPEEPAKIKPHAAPVQPAQVQSVTMIAAWDGTGVAPLGSVLQIDTTTMAAATVVVTNQADGGAFTGTFVFEGSADGVNWFTAYLLPVGSATAVTSTTAPGAWQLSVMGAFAFRVRCSALSSGTPLVTISASGY